MLCSSWRMPYIACIIYVMIMSLVRLATSNSAPLYRTLFFRRKFPNNARNWRDRSYNECAQKAIKKELNRIGKECRNSDQAADDCNDLGSAAARIIVRDSGYCPPEDTMHSASRGKNNLKKFRRECRSVGTGSCQGDIRHQARECGASLNTRQQSQLQRKCRDEVDRLTGNYVTDAI